MAGRDITSGMVTALEASTIRPVLMGRLDIVTDPVVAWTGPGTFAPTGTGDLAMDGQIFANAAPFIEMSDIVENQGIGGPVQLTVSGHDLDVELLKQIINDKREWRGRSAWLWIALLNADESTVVVDPFRIKTGIITQMTVARTGLDASVTVTIDKDLGRARSAPWRWLDHQRLYPADTWSSFILQLANKPEGFTDRGLRRDGTDLDDRDDNIPPGGVLP